jgi:hypothetical protein
MKFEIDTLVSLRLDNYIEEPACGHLKCLHRSLVARCKHRDQTDKARHIYGAATVVAIVGL